jgi:hypothetical protein
MKARNLSLWAARAFSGRNIPTTTLTERGSKAHSRSARTRCYSYATLNLSANLLRVIDPRSVIVAAAILLAAGSAPAANILVNQSFEADGYNHVIPTGWSRYEPPTAVLYQPFGNYYVEDAPAPAEDGTFFWKEWGACYDGTNNVAGIYQVQSSSPGSMYQANGWFESCPCDLLGADCFVWIQVSFLNSGSNVLAVYKSDDFTAAAAAASPGTNWYQYFVTNACDITQPVSLGDPYFTRAYAVTGSVSQMVAPPGTAFVRYDFYYLQNTSEGGSCFFDNAVLNQGSGAVPPQISNLNPANEIFVPPTNGLHFNVSSASGNTFSNSAIHLVLNGTDVSSSLAFTGTASNKNVSYSGLQSNLNYTATITVTDSFHLTASASTYFQTTWVGIPPVMYLWEAEDWDFASGMFIDVPDLCNAAGDPNCYFGKVGTVGVDEQTPGYTGNHLYRAGDLICTSSSGDYTRPNLAAAARIDYAINPYVTGDWIDYTRDWPAGTFWMIGRLATAASGTLAVSLVNTDSTTTALGTFTINNGPGYSTYQSIFLLDTNNNKVNLSLNGKATLRVTSGGNLLPTFFALVTATADLPILSGMYPTGTRPFEYTNAFSFAVSVLGATLPTSGIKLKVDGIDVSASLAISGTPSNKSVVYPGLTPNGIHTAIITVTNSLGHGITVTNNFDTFSENNYMVETEDFDYSGGQFITNYAPDCYADYLGPYPATTNIDYVHTSLSGEVFVYRSVGIPQDSLNGDDYLRQDFRTNGAVDYVLVFFAGGDWANYTRIYPSGSYYVYGRFSGGGPFTMYLDQVVSGQGTTNQTTKRLGTWNATGLNYTTFQWVPLADAGLTAPAIVKLNGTSTLRITTVGFCNPNYFMLVPASGITLTVARSGANIVLSFPTQSGLNYRIFYETSLASGNWNLLTTVPGTGSVVHVNDPITVAPRFYKVVSP